MIQPFLLHKPLVKKQAPASHRSPVTQRTQVETPIIWSSQVSHYDHFSMFAGSLRGATIVDALDTLYIMEMYDEFEAATEWVEKNLDFNMVRFISDLGAPTLASGKATRGDHAAFHVRVQF